ncbi:MAG: ABC transporter permease [Omnitrophica bacterium]|nr:ABC transporter permease [Candidatus Omnitrophota bacterium]
MIPELYLVRRYIFRGGARHISFIAVVSCLGVALGVATLIIVMSVMNGFDRDLTDSLMKFNHHLRIESFDKTRLPRIKEILQAREEIEGASIFLQTQVFAKFDNLIVPLVVKGIDFTDEKELKIFSKYIKEDNHQDGFFVGQALRDKFFISDKIEFYPLGKKLKLKKAHIRGIFKIGLYDIDNNYIITDLEKAKSLSPNHILFLGVRLKDAFKVSDLKQKLKKDLGKGVFISTWMESNRVLFSALKLEKITMFIILSLIILVASFNIFATLSIKVVEKTKDIGILKSLGFTSKKILTVFSLQGLLLGFIGTIGGTVLGLGLCILLKKYPFIKLPAEIYYIKYLPVAINYRDISLIIFVGLFLSYVFSLLPAIKAARLSASEALRYG